MASLPKASMTVEEYLDFERASEIKHEYFGGEVFAMTGGSKEHNIITINVGASLHAQLRERPCTVFSSDQRVGISATGLFTYPDITVVCGRADFWGRHQDTLLNPTLIVEVLSPSTERDDRGRKFQHYRSIASLREYVLVAQDSHRIERFMRQEGAEWRLADAVGIGASLDLPTIGCRLTLAEVYAKVQIATNEADRSGYEPFDRE